RFLNFCIGRPPIPIRESSSESISPASATPPLWPNAIPLLSGGGKQLLCLAARGRVAFAGDFFQRLAVEDVDQSAPVADEPSPLQKAGGDGHGGAAHAEHLA